MTRAECLGLMIRDTIEGRTMLLYDENGAVKDNNQVVGIEFVDVSHAKRPIVHFDDDTTLIVSIGGES